MTRFTALLKFKGSQFRRMSSFEHKGSLRTLKDFGNDSGPNIFLQSLTEAPNPDGYSQFHLRGDVLKAHYVQVVPEKVKAPYFVSGSTSCALSIGLDPTTFATDKFVQAFAGNTLLPGLNNPWASVYGCHCYGSWFGQLGDGRAMSIGEVEVTTEDEEHNAVKKRYELQLKGCGRTPFSRGFDGRAVLRSTIREFLVSEAMHHLRVSTTRALCVVGTGEPVARPWYAASSKSPSSRKTKFPPNTMIQEPGAVMCRVAPSFVRIAQMELFAKRGEFAELKALADFAIYREFPHLLSGSTPSSASGSSADVYVSLFKEIVQATGRLVTDWLRVGYTQGNMNSDNILVAGRTLDYGPYGFVEKFDPYYQPFTSDQDGKFSFVKQPHAMHVNIITLSQAFTFLVENMGLSPEDETRALGDIDALSKDGFAHMFETHYNSMRRMKLGLDSWGTDEKAMHLHLQKTLHGTPDGVDYTIFYRELSCLRVEDTPADAFIKLRPSFYSFEKAQAYKEQWEDWLELYLQRLRQQDVDADAVHARVKSMNDTNPKFILRNWMAILAYDAAKEGDTSIVDELTALLASPYDEQSAEMTSKWYSRTPDWATDMPGASYMS